MFSVLVWGYNWILIHAWVILSKLSNSSSWTKIYSFWKKKQKKKVKHLTYRQFLFYIFLIWILTCRLLSGFVEYNTKMPKLNSQLFLKLSYLVAFTSPLYNPSHPRATVSILLVEISLANSPSTWVLIVFGISGFVAYQIVYLLYPGFVWWCFDQRGQSHLSSKWVSAEARKYIRLVLSGSNQQCNIRASYTGRIQVKVLTTLPLKFKGS